MVNVRHSLIANSQVSWEGLHMKDIPFTELNAMNIHSSYICQVKKIKLKKRVNAGVYSLPNSSKPVLLCDAMTHAIHKGKQNQKHCLKNPQNTNWLQGMNLHTEDPRIKAC